MSTKTDISPSIHPAVIERHYGRSATPSGYVREPDKVLDEMASAMAFARSSAEQILDMHRAIMGNRMQTPVANARDSREATWRAFERLAKRIDAARETARAALAEIATATAAPPRAAEPADAMLASEIRTRLAQLSEKERRAVVSGAVSGGDIATVSAVLNAPAILTGMTDAEKEMFRHEWRVNQFPAEVDREQRLGKAIEDVDRVGPILMSLVGSLTDAAEIDAATASERAAVRARQTAEGDD